ncbi:hypothetical protein HOLleu_20391 [Holothuria leucospilota]|uniref:HYR domain-containing protein n=1 Tax=Holothuria leucospilota TaxID=206669 RepID=A0A9Q1C1F0_HOLLE|nr:hypothetical protein HOLleu_20391 [Holothuria leucospilota]
MPLPLLHELVLKVEGRADATDVTSPIANCPAKQIVNATKESNTKAVVEWNPASCEDNSEWDVGMDCTHQPGEEFELGNTTVQCTCTDREGNIGECCFDIIVKGRSTIVVNVPDRNKLNVHYFFEGSRHHQKVTFK